VLQAQLATELAIGQASTGAVVDALERRSLISREPDPRDRRSWLVTATAETHDMVKRIVAIDRGIGRELRHNISEGEIRDLGVTLAAIGENLDAMWQAGNASAEKKARPPRLVEG
jgi:DNA-binding MarR family transcriptional regulator